MAYDPDLRNPQNILECKQTFVSKDRQDFYDEVVNHLAKKFGVTQVGDVLTVRSEFDHATFILHEVILRRDMQLD